MARDGFDDIIFPMEVAIGARMTLRQRTDVVQTASGGEVRRQRWARGRRVWDISGAIRSLADAESVLSFFSARAGRARAFAFFDPFDHSSAPGGGEPTSTDQTLGTGDGSQRTFAFSKRAGEVTRPVDLVHPQTVQVAVDGVPLTVADFDVAEDRDAVTLISAPTAGAVVTAGFLFDTPARFDTDEIVFEMGAQGASLPSLPLIEVGL